MTGAPTAIDLSLLPVPAIVETLSFEAILAAMLADLIARDSTFSALVESDPAYKVLEVAAYREVLIRQRINDAAKACMLAYARGADLENIAALFGVTRLIVTPADPDAVPPVAAVYETDTALRLRVQLALEGLSVAGPEGAYLFHALRVGAVKDASAVSPEPGEVVVTLLGHEGDGTVESDVVDAVEAILTDDDVRPLTDSVTVQAATIVEYVLTASLTLYQGPDSAVVLAAATAAATAWVAARHKLGNDIKRSGLFAALHQPGVQGVTISAPASDLEIDPDEAAYCTAITITIAGRDE